MKRVITALILVPVVVWVILWSPPTVWLSVTAIVAALAFSEFRHIAQAHGSQFPLVPSVLAGTLFLLAPGWMMPAVPAVLAVVALALSLRTENLSQVLPNCGGFLLGMAYIYGSWRASITLGDLDRHWLLFATALNWVGDVAAYWAGSALGKHKLAPVVSPKKSWEGSIASALASAAFGVVFLGRYLPEVGSLEAAALSVAANAAGQIGDLSESALKRGAGVKDSGASLPGHGGWLDRIDSTLFAIPVVLFWVLLRQ